MIYHNDSQYLASRSRSQDLVSDQDFLWGLMFTFMKGHFLDTVRLT